jgi:uncharacterized protein (UPF0276 family)
MKTRSKFLGFGLGLRTDHFHYVLDNRPQVDWFEIISENFMVPGGKPKYFLHAIREHYPMVMHGVSLSIGSVGPLDENYLRNLKQLADEIMPEWISDHLCWASINHINSHDLLPLPYNKETLDHIVERIRIVQDYLERPFLMENVSSYLSYKYSEIDEWEFLSNVVERADCGILLDVNNIYVSARNHGFKPEDYIDAIDPARVWQFHLAGHSDYGDYVIDTHDHDVPDPVWELYRYALKRFGPVSTMIERDDNIPPFPNLYAEMNAAKRIAKETLPELGIDAFRESACA